MTVSAQADRHDVRAGNRKFAKGDFKSADIFYRKGLNADSTSFASAYNLANTSYRLENMEEAAKQLEGKEQAALDAGYGADYYFNKGDVALAKKDYQQAVDAFRKSLLLRPDDMDAKSNYAYAKKMLENQDQNGGGGQDQNKDQQDQNQDQNGGGDQNQDQQNQDQQSQNQNSGQQDQPQQSGVQEQKISPQQAQQMLKAIQAKEKETQEKVDKEKAAQEKTRQREKNW